MGVKRNWEGESNKSKQTGEAEHGRAQRHEVMVLFKSRESSHWSWMISPDGAEKGRQKEASRRESESGKVFSQKHNLHSFVLLVTEGSISVLKEEKILDKATKVWIPFINEEQSCCSMFKECCTCHKVH